MAPRVFAIDGLVTNAPTTANINLLDYRRDVYSQNGDDGIIERIFETVGETTRWCCEFGAWDGIHLSNTRRLVEQGWYAVLIESNPKRFAALCDNNAPNNRVIPLHSVVDTGDNSLDRILRDVGAEELDLLVIDIDGLDFEVFDRLEARPRVICVEVVGAHAPESRERVPREIAAKAIGQPLGLFYDSAVRRGYRLVSYFANAYFVREDVACDLPALTPTQAYERYLAALEPTQRRWLAYCADGHALGYRFDNALISPEALGLPRQRFPVRMWLLSLIWRLNRFRE